VLWPEFRPAGTHVLEAKHEAGVRRHLGSAPHLLRDLLETVGRDVAAAGVARPGLPRPTMSSRRKEIAAHNWPPSRCGHADLSPSRQIALERGARLDHAGLMNATPIAGDAELVLGHEVSGAVEPGIRYLGAVCRRKLYPRGAAARRANCAQLFLPAR